MTQIAEFRSALKKGLGRAMIQLKRDFAGQELQAELMHACQVNLVYDTQCEDARAPYLCRLIHETGQSH